MSTHKITPFISDIKRFFKNNDLTEAMQTISMILSEVRMTERFTLGVKSKCNTRYSVLGVFQALIVMAFMGSRNISRSRGSSLEELTAAQKDVYYRFIKNPSVKWRNALWSISCQLWNKIRLRSELKSEDTCLIIDDTDFHKTGRTIENIGRVYSHLEHKCILGFKALFMAVTDGVSQIILDFALMGEKGKTGKYGMSAKEIEARHQYERELGIETYEERVNEYSLSKIELAKQMIRRAIKRGVRFSYVLADSWFTCKELIRFMQGRHVKCHWLGMIKVGDAGKGQGKMKFKTEHGLLNASALVRKFRNNSKIRKYSRRLNCYYMTFDATVDGMKVRLFLIRRGRKGQWNGLLTTDRELQFIKAWEIYSRRWTLEVLFKDCKQYLGLGKCQSTNFASQIADTTLCAIRYNILSVAKRFSDYETVGELFRAVSEETRQLSVAQQIWGILQTLVNAIVELFGISEETAYDTIINRSEEIKHICQYFNLKSAS